MVAFLEGIVRSEAAAAEGAGSSEGGGGNTNLGGVLVDDPSPCTPLLLMEEIP